jgi:hypothetical protein
MFFEASQLSNRAGLTGDGYSFLVCPPEFQRDGWVWLSEEDALSLTDEERRAHVLAALERQAVKRGYNRVCGRLMALDCTPLS